MFSLVHFLESFDVKEQVQALIQVMPDLVKQSAGWTAILYSRMMNDAIAQAAFEEGIRSINDQKRSEIYQLLLLASTKFSLGQITKVA